MANFMGGSAPAMANQIADGFILLTANTLRGFRRGELAGLRAEIEKLQRDARAVVPAAGRRPGPAGPQPQDRAPQLGPAASST